jgi:uncharacterized protein (DUF736 family)
MTILGTFAAVDGGYAGEIHTLTLSAALRLVPSELGADKAPSHRVLRGEAECGAAWPASDESGVLSVRLDDPAWAQPLRARLVRGRDEGFVLVWRRPSPD